MYTLLYVIVIYDSGNKTYSCSHKLCCYYTDTCTFMRYNYMDGIPTIGVAFVRYLEP